MNIIQADSKYNDCRNVRKQSFYSECSGKPKLYILKRNLRGKNSLRLFENRVLRTSKPNKEAVTIGWR
jgi:hypothetical protein